MTATAVRFVIPELPPGTPAGTLFLTGDHRGWSSDPQGWAFQRETQGAVLIADLPVGSLLGVKVRLLGTDGCVTEEGDAWGGRAPAHKAVIHADRQMVTLSLAGWQDDRQGRGRPPRSSPPRAEFALAAPWGEQLVRLWWPEGTPDELPLLILHDGQNVFDEGPTFAGSSWDAGGAASMLAGEGHPFRIAALPVNDERSRRYVPFPFEMNAFNPGADEYLDWLRDGLKPELERRFGPPTHTALAGSSFGGLITLYAGLRDPGEYGTWGVFSPAIWPADFELLRWMARRTDPKARVWVDMGDHEGRTAQEAAETVQLTYELAETLRPKVQEVQVTIGEGHWHDEEAWRARLPAFLRWWLTSASPRQ
ncbi:alpha/beta hydrolase [Deinococcus fonticola]|uniref:alpha/beta hydrolase n=1 Tax=Deinococcus fonticola TaxID=2528713 RepID=UPI001075472B|nr:alpha/beta hydrolase-fold protein [Deinococcus fonticola]